MFRPPDWTSSAACLDKHEEYDEGRPTRALLARCQSCPVLSDCLAHALRHEVGQPRGLRGGIFAGLTPDQRVKLDARSTHCVGCGVRTGAGPCEGCLRRAKRYTASLRSPLRCVQCGGPTSDDAPRCNYCANDGNAGRWAPRESERA